MATDAGYLERLASTADWGERIVAANVCFEPIVGTLIRRELGTRAAAANGDGVTPVLARAETQEWEWVRSVDDALTRFLLEDPVHGGANRTAMAGWIEEWLPQAFEAAVALIPLADRVPSGSTLRRDRGVQRYAGAMLADRATGARCVVGTSRPRRSHRRGAGRCAGTAPRGACPERCARRTLRLRRRNWPSNGDGTYDFVGIVMAKSAEGTRWPTILGQRMTSRVIEQPAFWDIRARDRLVIPYDEVSEQLGYEIDAYSIQHEMSTHYGRMVAGDDALMLFSDPTEAMQYLMS